jgi:tetratricopeptide (TPR) repeat protein
MPTVNRRLLLRLFAVIVLLGGGLAGLHYAQADRVPEALLWQASHAADDGKLDKAILYTRQYLEFRPEDYDAAVRLGELILKRGNSVRELSTVLFIYERVVREAPQRDDVRRKLVDLCVRLNRTTDALIHAQTLIERLPNDSKLWEQMAICQVAQNQFEEGRQALEKAIQVDPANVSAYERLAHLLEEQLHQPDAAQACYERVVKTNPADPQAFLARAGHWKQLNKTAECMRDLERVLELSPKNADALLMTAEVLQGRGEIARARQMLTEAAALYPRDMRMYRSLSWLEVCLGNIPGAVACLEQGMKELPNEIQLLTPLADLLIQQNDLERAQSIIARLETKKDRSGQVGYLKGRMLMQQGKWAEAVAAFEPLRTEAVSTPGLAAQLSMLLSACHDRLGNDEAYAEALQRVLTIDPSHLSARLALGGRHLAEGRWDEAIREYTVAAKSPYAPLGVHITLGRLQIVKARATQAGPQEWHEVGQYIERLRERFKQSAEPVILASEWLSGQGEFEKAAQLLRKEAGRKLNDPRLWVELANVTARYDGWRAALEVLDDAQGLIGDQVELRLARGQLWTHQRMESDGPAREEKLQQLERRLEAFPDAEQLRLLSGLADLYANARDTDALKRIYRLLAVRMPRDVAVRKALCLELLDEDSAGELPRLLQEIQRLEGGSNLTVTLLSALRVIEKSAPRDPAFARAAEALPPLLAAAPDRGDVHFLVGRIAEKSGDVKAAARHYEQAVGRDRSSLRYLQADFSLLLRAGDDTTAKRMLERLYYDPRLTPQRFQALLNASLANAPEATIRKCIGWLDPLAAKDALCLMAIGDLLAARKLGEQAEAEYRACVAAAPKMVDGWRTLIAYLATHGRADWDAELGRSNGILGAERYCRLCADCMDAIHSVQPKWQPPLADANERRLFAQARLAVLVGRGEREQAVALLKGIVGDATARPEDVAWARRSLTLMAVVSGKPEERVEALRALLQEKAAATPTLEERRGRVSVLAAGLRHLKGAERKAALAEAIETLGAAVSDKDATTKDWYLLAQFQRQAGDRAGYRKSMSELIRREPENLFYVSAYLDELLQANDLTAAEQEVGKLHGAVHDLRVAASVARYYCLSDAPARVVETVEKYAQAADPGTPEALGRLRQAAELLDQLARLAGTRRSESAKVLAGAALEKYRMAMRTSPDVLESYVALMAHQGQATAALELIQERKTQLSPRALAAAGLAVVRQGGATPRQFQTVRQWVETARAEQPAAIAPLLELAELGTLQQDYAAAEQAYRAVVKVDPKNVVALNNLAWLIAPRPESATEALGLIDRAIQLAGVTGELLDTRARILIAAGRYDRAIEDLNDALSQSQTSLRYFHLAVAQLKQARKEDALAAFKKAKARGLDPKVIHPNDLPAYKAFASETGS